MQCRRHANALPGINEDSYFRPSRTILQISKHLVPQIGTDIASKLGWYSLWIMLACSRQQKYLQTWWWSLLCRSGFSPRRTSQPTLANKPHDCRRKLKRNTFHGPAGTSNVYIRTSPYLTDAGKCPVCTWINSWSCLLLTILDINWPTALF